MMKSLRKRLGVGLVAAGLVLGALTGCAGFSGGVGAGDSSSGSAVTLMTWASPQDRKLYQASLDKLTKKTGIKVNIVYVGSAAQYFQKINSMVLSNTLPDIFWCNNLNAGFQPLAASGKLFDWTAYINGTAQGASKTGLDQRKFGPGYLDFYKVDGKQYGIPNEVNTYGVFYNATLFKQAGLALPSSRWTWNDLFNDMKKLTVAKGGKVSRYGMQTTWTDLYDPVGLSTYAVSNGGQGLAKTQLWKNVKSFATDPQLTTGGKRWAEAIKNGWVTNPDFTGASTYSAFINGQVPMAWGGQWNAVPIFGAKPKFTWGFAPIPRGSAMQVAPLEANAFCSPKKLASPGNTWQVISWMLTHVFNDAYAEDPVAPIAYVPGSRGYFDNLSSHGAIGKQVRATVEQELENPHKIGTEFLDPWAGKAANLLKSLWNPMLEGKKPVGPTLAKYVTEVNKLIAGGQ